MLLRSEKKHLSRKHKCESAFLTMKDRRNSFKPGSSVISAVHSEAEKCFHQMFASTNGRLPQGKGIPHDAIAASFIEWYKYPSKI